MKSELIESPWWMRLIASPSRRATVSCLIFLEALASFRASGQLVFHLISWGERDSARIAV
jgi:hypothetical protein